MARMTKLKEGLNTVKYLSLIEDIDTTCVQPERMDKKKTAKRINFAE